MEIVGLSQAEIDEVWYQPRSGIVWPDLDIDGERDARIAYLARTASPGVAVAACYRCERGASVFVRLRVSSLTPVCADHLDAIGYTRMRGELVESATYPVDK